ncbi:MAG: hypothetical protein WBD27_03785 [Pyrinomonadaceae bacterium]
MERGNVYSLAEKIARILENESRSVDLSTLHESIEKLNHRIDNIESRLEPSVAVLPSSSIQHPSTELFSVIEAFADEIIANLDKEKACTFEPNGKPCDHCSMCSSRGF